jgi:hypothetical protein
VIQFIKRGARITSNSLGTGETQRDVQVSSIAISADLKIKRATVNFKTPPTRFSLDRNEWSFKIPDCNAITPVTKVRVHNHYYR